MKSKLGKEKLKGFIYNSIIYSGLFTCMYYGHQFAHDTSDSYFPSFVINYVSYVALDAVIKFVRENKDKLLRNL